jgi:enoyl-CoA hydratase/carnithine racemase
VSYHVLKWERREGVLIIHLTRPKDLSEKARLSGELDEISTNILFDNEVRVVVLAGSGEHPFSLEPDASQSHSEENDDRRPVARSLAEPLAKLDVPIIAEIRGDVMGQGLELVLACDIRIASETSRFGHSHIKAGLIPSDGGTQRLSRLVGRAKAIEMILTGEMIDAREALRINLINRLLPPERVTTDVLEMAKAMANRAPIALKYAKEAVSKGMDMTLEQGLRLEADLYLLLHTTRDRTEGIKTFREKKTPRFEGK